MESFNHSPVLFVKTDGKALEFYTYYTGEEKTVIQSMIEQGGGLFHTEKKHRAFLLVEPGDENSEKIGKKQIAVSMEFIWDCVQQNHLLDVDNYILPSVVPFSKDEDLTIIKYVLMYADNKCGTLTELFECLSSKRVLQRDAYSIKSRAKRIYWRFSTYCLTEEEERKFKSIIKPSAMHNGFCEEDDYAIINFVKNRVSISHEKEIYKEMERKGILKYTFTILHARALTHIFPNIDLYEISLDLKKEIKMHLSTVYRLSYKSSPDDYAIVQYMLGNIHSMRNITSYKIMKEKNALSYSIQYLFLRFLYYILPNIDSYNIFPYFKKRFKNAATMDGFALCYDFSIQVKSNAWFSEDEDYLLIYSIQHLKKNIDDFAIYKDLENKQILRRSAQAMKARFLNRILPDIDTYSIPYDLKIAFKTLRKRETVQKKKKKKSNYKSDSSICSSDESDNSDESWYLPEEYSDSLITEKSTFAQDGVSIHSLRSHSSNVLNESHESDIVPPSYSQGTVENSLNVNSDNLNASWSLRSPSANGRSLKRVETNHADVEQPKSKKSHLEINKNLKHKPTSSTNSLGNSSKSNKSSSTVFPESSKKQETIQRSNANNLCSGDLRQYFSSKSSGLQRRLGGRNINDSCDGISNSQSSDIFQAGASAFSQGSIIDDLVNDPLAPSTFLSILLKRVPKILGNRKTRSSKNQCESLEYFPVDEKVQFVTDTVNLLLDIELTELFQAYVVDSEFYSDLAAKLYKINKNVYESFLEKEVDKILKKEKLNFQDKSVLIKYLACLDQLSPEDTKKFVSELTPKSSFFRY